MTDPAATVKRRLAAMTERLRAAANAALLQAGAETVSFARQSLAAADEGVPSAPGAAPRDPAGRLAGSLVTTLDEAASRVSVGSASPVARYLEYGTRTMAPRPFLRPAVEATRPAAMEACRQALAQAARDTGEPA